MIIDHEMLVDAFSVCSCWDSGPTLATVLGHERFAWRGRERQREGQREGEGERRREGETDREGAAWGGR